MSNQSKPNAEGQSSGNLSFSELVSDLAQEGQSEQANAVEQAEEITEEVTEQAEQVDQVADIVDEADEETEQADEEESLIEQLLATDPERLAEIARQAGTRSLSRYSKLTAEKKADKDRIAALEEQLAQRTEAKPLPEPIPNNPFAALKTPDEVAAKISELKKVAKDTDAILDDNEDLGLDDQVHINGEPQWISKGKPFTKRLLKAASRNCRDALTEFLPAQAAEIERSGALKAEAEQWKAAIPNAVPELADEESLISKKFKEAREQNTFALVTERVPEFPQFELMLACAIAYLHGPKSPIKKAATAPGTTARPKVPSSPVGAGASSPIAGGSKAVAAKEKALTTGNQSDMVAWLAQQT